MGYTLKLEQGYHTLDLSSGRYSSDFVPPSANEVVAVASGTSANRYSGGTLASRHGENLQFSFAVRIEGASNAETERGKQDLMRFIAQAGNENNPVYLTWQPNNAIPYKPIWGQANWKRLEIIHGTCTTWSYYGVATLRDKVQFITVDLTCKPYILGLRQSLAYGLGTYNENRIGTADGQTNGLYLYPAYTNLVPNPVFMNYSSAVTDWAATNVTAAAVNDDYCLPMSRRSVKLTATAANGTYCASVTTADGTTYTTSAYVKKIDGSAVSATDCKIYFQGAGQTSTYKNLGDGWYRVDYSGAASSTGAQEVGLLFPAVGCNLYLGGAQVTATAYACPLAIGDMLDCSWSSTAHNSNSATTAPKLDAGGGAINILSGTIRAVLKMECTQTSGNFTIFLANQSADLTAYYLAADDKFYLTDGTNTISSAAQTWADGDVLVLHFVWGLGQLAIYKNGASIASGSTYTPSDAPANLYIGSTGTPDQHVRALWQDFTIWQNAATAAQVLADYNNISQLTSDGQRVGTIPWLWSDDGDRTVDAIYGTIGAANYDSMLVAAGIPGSLAADTVLDYDTPFAAGTVTLADVYVNIFSARNYHHPTEGGQNALFVNYSGTTTDADSMGGAYKQQGNIGYASPQEMTPTTANIIRYGYEDFAEKPVRLSFRWQWKPSVTAGYTLYGAPRMKITSGLTITGEYEAYASLESTGYWRMAISNPVILPAMRPQMRGLSLTNSNVFEDVSAYMVFMRSSGATTGTINYDFAQLHPGRLSYLDGGNKTDDGAVISQNRVISYEGTNATKNIAVRGDPVELEPEAHNHIIFISSNSLTMDDGATDDATWNEHLYNVNYLYITPRWLVL